MTAPGACLARAAELWGVSPGSIVHVRDGANSVHEFQARGARFFLRLTDDRHRSRAQLEAELDFVEFAASRAVQVACPLPSSFGSRVETIQADGRAEWHAVVFAAAAGRHFRFFSEDVAQPLFRSWGNAMGALHAASRDFVPVGERRRPEWSAQETTACDASRVPPDETGARREHERLSEWLATLPKASGDRGLIHGDFERTNFTLDGGALFVYDFDDACYHWYVADVAHALWAFRNAPPRDRARFLRWFLAGYAERRPVATDMREQLSWFVRLRTLSLFLQRLAPGAPATESAWMQQVRTGFDTPFHW